MGLFTSKCSKCDSSLEKRYNGVGAAVALGGAAFCCVGPCIAHICLRHNHCPQCFADDYAVSAVTKRRYDCFIEDRSRITPPELLLPPDD